MFAGRERALVTIDSAAITANVGRLRALLPAKGRFCAVVKANGYGHGAVAAAQAALAGGADWLGVATVAEAEELRAAGLAHAVGAAHADGILPRLLVMGPLMGAEVRRAAAADADVAVWSERFLVEARAAGARVHVKFDSGMNRLGADAATAGRLATSAAAAGLLTGLMSHFATADEADTTFFDEQLAATLALSAEVRRAHPDVIVHAANSAATLRAPLAHCDMVRCGIAIYGLAPANDDPFRDGLRPALRLSSYLAAVRLVQPGASVGYGRRFIADRETRIGVVPIGYADGVSRALSNRGEVLIAGRRCRIVGTISMDQLTVELPGAVGVCGDEVVLIGESGAAPAAGAGRGVERILAEDVAHHLDTINYEVVCALGARVVRRASDAGPAA